ncbi:MAG: polysaccharide biosynthesis tyrosine autokinase, partial [Novipirellula sp. JB048]
ITDQLKSLAVLDRRDTLHELESRLETQSVLENLLSLQYEQMLGNAGESGNKMLELEFTRAELEREERVFELIAERSMALSTESRAPGRVALLQPAEPALRPIATLPLRNMIVAGLFSGCLPFALALLWELSAKPISNVDQLTHPSAMTMASEVAKLPVRTLALGSRHTKAMSIFEESIDSLRVELLCGDKHNHVQTLVVTSAVHGEGKSSISSQLAVSISRATGEPVLLVDGDLRAPDLHNIFQVPNHLGLTAVLEGRVTLDEALICDWSDHLHLLPAGRLRVNPHQLMTRDALHKIFDELRTRYRYIIIDTPPILSASESIVLARCTDGSLLCTRRNVSREGQVKIAQERLAKAGIKSLGTVLNGVPTRSYAKTYGSYDYARHFD